MALSHFLFCIYYVITFLWKVLSKEKNIYLIVILFTLILIKIIFFYFDYSKLTSLYDNPIKVNQKYENYTYDEFKNHVTILTYDGNEEVVNIPKYIKGTNCSFLIS